MEYNKLVRDRIPQLIEADGARAVFRTLDGAAYAACLERKLDEEVAEFHRDQSIEELADILEVVFALCRAKGETIETLMRVCDEKREKRGGFEERIFLIRREDDRERRDGK